MGGCQFMMCDGFAP
ncbi:MAG: hypothetical protein AB7T38_16360 [Nitrospirales bacterium]